MPKSPGDWLSAREKVGTITPSSALSDELLAEIKTDIDSYIVGLLEPKRCILFLTYSFLKAKSLIWRCCLIAPNFRKLPIALFVIHCQHFVIAFQGSLSTMHL